jgi:hypothetical protein
MLAAALALGSTGQLDGTVACVGFVGQVDVESSSCTCCAVSASHDDSIRTGLAPALPSCDDCVDVQLRVLPLRFKGNQLSAFCINADGRRLALSSGGGCSNHLLAVMGQVDQRWRSLSPLSTVVLLT